MDTKKEEEEKLVTEVPERLKNLVLFLIKAFYGLEHCVVVDYIQKYICVKEEQLRDLLKLDQRNLRTVLQTLKVDKMIKERVVTEEGILNVTKYKLDHMRQKLEGREKDDVHKASFRCSNDGCKKLYEAMDMMDIFNSETNEMRCWQCNHIVNPNDSAGPTEETRTSLAKFNEQMSGMYKRHNLSHIF